MIAIKKRPTIQMVADKVGVSRGTVDRVLNNRSHVSPDIYERVMAALVETGYLPPQQFHQRTFQANSYNPIKLGVLLPNWTGHFRTEIFRGIEAARAELVDFQVEIFLEECQTDVPQEAIELLDKLVSTGIQGIALCTPNTPTIETKISSFIEQHLPVITFNSDLPGSGRLCFVGQDINQSGRIAAELISKCIPSDGKILAAVGNLEFDGHRARLNGFKMRMQELGFCDSQIQVIQTFNDYQITYRKILENLEKTPDLNAIYMANRSVAGCTEAVNALGRKGKLRVICHDVAESTKRLLLDGSLDFTITQDIYRQGYLPLIYLREYLQKEKLPQSRDINTNISIICSQNLENT